MRGGRLPATWLRFLLTSVWKDRFGIPGPINGPAVLSALPNMPSNNFHKKGPVGCLLIHGFTGSPNEWLDLGEVLVEQNFTVSIPTLPGHATHSADLFNYTWRDWFNCVKEAYEELNKVCDEVFVCGLSTGGTLALNLAAHRSVQGIVALSTAIKFPTWQTTAIKFLKRVKKYRYKRNGEDVRDTSMKSKLASYQKYPLYAAEQFFQLLDHVRGDLPEITQPILIMHAKNDHSVAFSNSTIIFDEIGSTEKWKIDLEESYHIITVDVEKERVRLEMLNFIKTQSRILQRKPAKKATKPAKRKIS